MQVYQYRNLGQDAIQQLCQRSYTLNTSLVDKVQTVIEEVKSRGDAVLFEMAQQWDQVSLSTLKLNKEKLAILAAQTPLEQQEAVQLAAKNIRKFHESQIHQEAVVETMPGVQCWREWRAIEQVGLYIPGGSAVLPSTFLMLGVPAVLAGCKKIIVCTPPQKDGNISPIMAYCAIYLGIEEVYLSGGAQAIAAMALGTESIPKVDKIFGPGNAYVTIAKMLLQQQVAIDMPAGPSEVLIIADNKAPVSYVAADILAQLEHGADSQAVLLANDLVWMEQLQTELKRQLAVLPRKEIVEQSLKNSFMVYCEIWDEALQLNNSYKPEHLILALENPELLTDKILHAGSVFLGYHTPESAGDYASGTNHTLPTGGWAKAYSGVSMDSFFRKITFQQITPQGLQNIGPSIEILAEAEGLIAHKNSVTIRLQSYENK